METSTTRWIYGRNPVMECLKADPQRIQKVYVATGQDKTGRNLMASLRQAGVPLENTSKQQLGNLVKTSEHQGFVAASTPLPTASFRYLFSRAQEALAVLVLPRIQDPGNLGALIRSAEQLGVDLLVLGRKGCADIQLPSVAKASSGAVEHLPVVQTSRPEKMLDELRESGFLVFGLEADGPHGELFSRRLQPDKHHALVLGSEGFGLQQNLQERLDAVLSLPARGQVNSLNVSAAGALGMAWMKGLFCQAE